MAGTAPTDARWLFVEYAGSWGRQATCREPAARAGEGVSRGPARRTGPADPPAPGSAGRGDPGVHRGHRSRRVPGRGRPAGRRGRGHLAGPRPPCRAAPAPGSRRTTPRCGWCAPTAAGTVCCAERGRPIAEALAARWPEETWETTHLGGHRFAGTLLALPSGLALGRLDPTSAVRACADLEQGRWPGGRVRGRAGVLGRRRRSPSSTCATPSACRARRRRRARRGRAAGADRRRRPGRPVGGRSPLAGHPPGRSGPAAPAELRRPGGEGGAGAHRGRTRARPGLSRGDLRWRQRHGQGRTRSWTRSPGGADAVRAGCAPSAGRAAPSWTPTACRPGRAGRRSCRAPALLRFRHRFVPWLHRRYGDVFTVRIMPRGPAAGDLHPARARQGDLRRRPRGLPRRQGQRDPRPDHGRALAAAAGRRPSTSGPASC